MGLLNILARAQGRYVSGARLARDMGLSRAAIHKRIVKLRAAGHRIAGTNRLGYCLAPSPDLLDPEQFPRGLGRPFVHVPVLPTTQDEAKTRAAAGAPEGTLVCADRQIHGRGRRGRFWQSPRGGLWFSLVLRPALRPSQVPALTLVAALDWARAIRRVTGLKAGVKWPNDVWIGGRKAGGLLADMSSDMDTVHWMVLGVGLNVNNAAPRGTRFPAVSLRSALGRPVSRHELLCTWLALFQASYARYKTDGFPPFQKLCNQNLLFRNRNRLWDTVHGPVRGHVRGVDAEGRLLLKKAAGPVLALQEGEISQIQHNRHSV
jgi:BirA family transcriptional regulator, biotin operon repressor / biotin---[acetyl-CoA-carboxylase] ligase